MNIEEAQKLKEQIRIGGGITIAEAERSSGESIRNAVRDAWSKGVSVHYQDERCSEDPNEFISANPDGSEDLIYIDFHSREQTIIRNLALTGKGKYAHLTKSNKQTLS